MHPTTFARTVIASFVLAAAATTASQARTLSLEERVAAQRAIEQVYWRHRIWPAENPGPKPSLAAVLPESALRERVVDSLKMSTALEVMWQRPVTAKDLQNEINRMARDTRDGIMLREIFRALGDDPYVIAETLGRQTLVERLARDAYAAAASQDAFDAWWAESKGAISPATGSSSASYKLPDVAQSACTNDTWTPTLGGELSPRAGHTAVWTGSEMIVWGGTDGNGNFATGARYDPSTGTWTPVATSGAPSARSNHTAVWTGTQMIVWGGGQDRIPLNTGAVYSPTADHWTATSTGANCPSARYNHTAVWTGSQMVVWGGTGVASRFSTGGKYTPFLDGWTATATGGGCPTARERHTAVWTGSEMIVFGGADGATDFATGGRYTPSSNSWAAMIAAPLAVRDHGAVWNGSVMIEWGGLHGSTPTATGQRFNPATNAWSPTAAAGAPAARSLHTALWTGSEMIVWGGVDGAGAPLGTGARYEPSTDTWIASTSIDPEPRRSHTAVWTGSEMIVWGGDGATAVLATGERYDPATDRWTRMTRHLYTDARKDHVAIWTGTEMLVWGGVADEGYSITGSRYVPATDTWVPMSEAGTVPESRENATAIWTGTEMIVWGGAHLAGYPFVADPRQPLSIYPDPVNTGGRYDPAADRWSATSTAASCPSGRERHSAVWTGSKMIVWGGAEADSGALPVDAGGIYDPATDTWAPTSTGAGCPAARAGHTAVWTGARMLVWGGSGGGAYLDSGGSYDPSADAWSAMSPGTGVITARAFATAVWTGTEMIVWGGASDLGAVHSGGRYSPATDGWTATSMGAGVPSIRNGHTAVWTHREMVIWGGTGMPINTGGRYDPSTDSWTPTSMGAGLPAERERHTAVWTGSEMIVWGGSDGLEVFNSGGRYCACVTTATYFRDVDGDGFGDPAKSNVTCNGIDPGPGWTTNGSDCDDASAEVYPGAPEVNDGLDNECPGDPGFGAVDELSGAAAFGADKVTMTWTAQAGATAYDVARSLYADFHAGCKITHTASPSIVDAELPPTGRTFSYIVRSAAPWLGSWGLTSSGTERTVCAGCEATGDACDDENVCTVGDACTGITCISGAPLSCDDGNPCTNDSCDPVTGCRHTNNTAACDDGNACTVGDVCSGGACAGSLANAGHLVISQVQASGDGVSAATDEFIEIYNPTPFPASLTSWSLQTLNSTFPFSVDVRSLAGSIPAHGWYLVAPAGYNGAAAADRSSTFSMPSAGETIFLVHAPGGIGSCNDSQIVDKVAYGNGSCPEGTPAGAPAANNSILRRPGGSCGNALDTTNNANDFVGQAPSAPRNSASPPQP